MNEVKLHLLSLFYLSLLSFPTPSCFLEPSRYTTIGMVSRKEYIFHCPACFYMEVVIVLKPDAVYVYELCGFESNKSDRRQVMYANGSLTKLPVKLIYIIIECLTHNLALMTDNHRDPMNGEITP